MPYLEVQMRSEEGNLWYARTVTEAMRMAKEHPDIWKISWTDGITDERIRLVKLNLDIGESVWVYEPIVV